MNTRTTDRAQLIALGWLEPHEIIDRLVARWPPLDIEIHEWWNGPVYRPPELQISSRYRPRFSTRLRRQIIREFDCTCQYCGRHTSSEYVGPDGASWHIDHIYPLSRGGSHERSNWALSCRTCNSRKHNSLCFLGRQAGSIET